MKFRFEYWGIFPDKAKGESYIKQGSIFTLTKKISKNLKPRNLTKNF